MDLDAVVVEHPYRADSQTLVGQWEGGPNPQKMWCQDHCHSTSPKGWAAQREEAETSGHQVTWVVEGGCQVGKARSLWLLVMREVHMLYLQITLGVVHRAMVNMSKTPSGKLSGLSPNHASTRRKVIFIGDSWLRGVEAPSDDLRQEVRMFIVCCLPRCCKGIPKACPAFGLLLLAAFPCRNHWANQSISRVTSELWEQEWRSWEPGSASSILPDKAGKTGEVDSSSESTTSCMAGFSGRAVASVNQDFPWGARASEQIWGTSRVGAWMSSQIGLLIYWRKILTTYAMEMLLALEENWGLKVWYLRDSKRGEALALSLWEHNLGLHTSVYSIGTKQEEL